MNDCTQELQQFATDIINSGDTEDVFTIHEILNKLSKLNSDALAVTNRNLARLLLEQGYLS